MNSPAKIWDRLQQKAYRDGYSDAQRTVLLPFQIAALREGRGWSQEELAQKCGWSASRQATIETVGADALTWKTLEKLATALDIGLLVKFAPFSELVREEAVFNPNTFKILRFEQDGLNKTPQAILTSLLKANYKGPTAHRLDHRSLNRSLINKEAYNDFRKRPSDRSSRFITTRVRRGRKLH